jgi:ribosomal protein S18 acetylase RimI-like enzyme
VADETEPPCDVRSSIPDQTALGSVDDPWKHAPVVDAAPSPVMRMATVADAHEIAVFHTACWKEAYPGIVPQEYLERVTVEDRERRWQERLVSGVRRTALVQSQRGILGVASWGRTSLTDLPPFELMSLYVDAHVRGDGTARSLLTFALGQEPAHLLVFASNHRAQSFYRKCGFGFDGHRQIDPDTGVIEMRMVR